MTSVALEYRGDFNNGLSVQAGLRRDFNQVFQDASTYNLALSYQLPGRTVRLHASAGNAVVNPSFFELFANSFGTIGNPNLKPERNKGFDLGFEAEFANGRGLIDVTYFNEIVTDEISFSFGTGPGGSNTYINATGESPREGVEITANFEATDALLLGLNYTYTDTREPNGTVEIRRPRHEVGLSATLDTYNGRGTVTVNVRHVSGLFDNEFFGAFRTDVKMPAFTTVDLATTYQLNDNVELYGRIENLFDEDYQEVLGFATRGATAYVGLRASF
jgi:vitamin B12 transporter